METMSDSDDFQDEIIDNDDVEAVLMAPTQPAIKRVESLPKQEVKPVEEKKLSELQTVDVSSEIKLLLNAVVENENNKDAWNNLANGLRSARVDEARRVFDVILKQFPTCGRFVRYYCEIEERNNNFGAVERLLKQYLLKCPSIDIWTYYCEYYDRRYTSRKSGADLLKGREEADKVYNYAINTVGYFIDSNDLWRSYKSFIDRIPRNDQDPNYYTWTVQNRRKFFHRAVVVPISYMESLWREYIEFEKSSVAAFETDPEKQKTIMESMMSLVLDRHDVAMSILKPRIDAWKDVLMGVLPVRALSKEDTIQADNWRHSIQYELSNPLKLPDEHLTFQIRMTYLRCLTCCRYCPDLWLDYASYESNIDMTKAVDILKESATVMPGCEMLRIGICEFYEMHDMLTEAEREYEQMISETDTATGWIMYQRFVRRHKGVSEAREVFRRARLSLLKPEIFIAAEYDQNHQPKSAMNIYRSGMSHFSRDVNYIISFVDFLLKLGDPDNARILLEQSIKTLPSSSSNVVWEKFLDLQWRYSMNASSLRDIVNLEKQYAASKPDNMLLLGMMGSIPRYTIFGYKPESQEDEVLLKRKRMTNSAVTSFGDRSKIIVVSSIAGSMAASSTPAVVTEIPDWLKPFLAKLPPADTPKGRGTIVDALVATLSRVKIPKPEALIVTN